MEASEKHGPEEGAIPHDLPTPSATTLIAVGIAFVLLLVALFIIGYIPAHRATAQANDDAAQAANDAPAVSVAQPKKSTSAKDVILPADVRAFQETSLFLRTNGYLKKLHVDIQDHVNEKDLLAEIDTPEVDAQLAQSKAALEQSRAAVVKSQSDLSLAQKTLERYLEAQRATKGSVTEEDLDTRRASVEQSASALVQSKANVVAAEADVQRLEVLQGYQKVYAPFSGTITFRGYDVGALLASGNGTGVKELFRIQQTDPLKVYVNVPQTYASRIKTGQAAFLVVRNYGNRRFEGKVARTTASLDPTTRTMSFELHFPNADGALYAGMYGQVQMGVTEPAPVLVIPTSALVFNAGGTQVGVVRDGKAHFQKIEVGRDLGTELEVVAGLDDQDQVITNPGERLVEGVDVKMNQTDKQTADAGK